MKHQKEIIAGALMFFSLLTSAFFLNASGISTKTILGLNGFSQAFSIFFSINFALFLALFPINFALVACFAKIFEKKTLYKIIAISFALFGLTAFFLFSNLQEFLIAGIGLFASLLIGVEIAFVKFSELKTLPFLRTSVSVASNANTFIAIALFISTSLIVLPQQNTIVGALEDRLISMTINENLQTELSDAGAQVFVEGQKQTLQAFYSSPQFQALATKDDPDVLAFLIAAQAFSDEINSQEYLETVKKEFDKQSSEKISQTDFEKRFDQLKEQIPIVKFFEDFFWLFAGFAVSTIFLLFGSIIIKPLSAVYGFFLGLFVQNLEKP